MHTDSLERWQHSHVYLGSGHARNERRTWLVVALTAATMVAEIFGGNLFGSMAVVADGWHMSTHAGALAIAALAYRFARRHAGDPRFTFGTGKVGELAAFSSALLLAMIALLIGYEALHRVYAPVQIDFTQATWLAAAGLAVNLASVWLLTDDAHATEPAEQAHPWHAHENVEADRHDHRHHHHHHHHQDTNLRAAYVHVLADAMTSVLAIVALLAGRFYGWVWLDPVMALVGVAVILSWSAGLLRSAGAILLDMQPDRQLARTIRAKIETGGDRISDLHLWRLGPGHTALIVAIVSDRPQEPDVYRERLAGIGGLSHVTVEVHGCPEHGRRAA